MNAVFLKSNVLLADVGEELPTRILLFKAGENETSKGLFVYDVSLKDELNQHMNGWDLLSFDVDHLSLNDTAGPEARKSIGWFKVSADDAGIWATDIEWTSAGASLLKERAYRFVSPAFLTDEDGRITAIINCALTNQPATLNQSPIIAKDDRAQDNMAKKKTDEQQEPVQLAEDAEDDEKKQKEEEEEQLNDGEQDAPTDEVPPMTDEEKDEAILALQSQVKALQEENDALRAELDQMKAEKEGEEVDETATKERIAASLIQCGRLTPAHRPWFLSLSLSQASAYSKLHGSDPAKAMVKGRVQIKSPDQLNSFTPKAITQQDVAPPTEDVRQSPIYRKLRGIR